MSNNNNNNNKKFIKECIILFQKINENYNKSHVEDGETIIIGTTPEISTSFSPIGRNIVILQTNCLS